MSGLLEPQGLKALRYIQDSWISEPQRGFVLVPVGQGLQALPFFTTGR